MAMGTEAAGIIKECSKYKIANVYVAKSASKHANKICQVTNGATAFYKFC